jgi:hypothetical protein
VALLLDNAVPREVTHLLRERGEDVLEVRDVLAANAPDADELTGWLTPSGATTPPEPRPRVRRRARR